MQSTALTKSEGCPSLQLTRNRLECTNIGARVYSYKVDILIFSLLNTLLAKAARGQ